MTGVQTCALPSKVTFVVHDEDGQAFDTVVTEVIHGESASIPKKYTEFSSLMWFDGNEQFDFGTPINSDKTLNGYFPS